MPMPPDRSPLALSGIRMLIDGVDDALLLLLAARRRCVQAAAAIKQDAGLPLRDTGREQQVRTRATRLGRRLGIPETLADALAGRLILDACQQQGAALMPEESPRADPDQRGVLATDAMLPAVMTSSAFPSIVRWLRWLPPPQRLAPLVRRVPARWQARWLDASIARVLAAPLAQGALEPLRDRTLGIEVSDLDLRWVVCFSGERLRVCAPDTIAEATVRGTATDLLLLASRREDADTLFFQRRLRLTGDTELGLTARNLLDQLPWDSVPLGLRIALHRGAGLAEAARAAHRLGRATLGTP